MLNLSRAALLLTLIFTPFCLQATEKIDVNTAPLEDLIKIIHIGETRAQELISLRPFSSLDDLARIKGIGESRVEDIKNQGLAWVAEGNISYPSGVIFNEILPSPEGPDADNEWIEIFNENDFTINLSGWQIKDSVGRFQTYTFPEGTEINSKGLLVLTRPETSITLNNDGDSLKLIQPDGKTIDGISYEKAPRGKSFNLTYSGWVWSETLTPGAKNVIPVQTAREEEEIKQNGKEKQLAAASQSGYSNNLFFLTALFLAAFSGIVILGLKKKLKLD
jgi:hypothetical protein